MKAHPGGISSSGILGKAAQSRIIISIYDHIKKKINLPVAIHSLLMKAHPGHFSSSGNLGKAD